MSRCNVVVEGPADEVLLRAVLQIPVGNEQVAFLVAGGWSAADSLARSLLANRRGDVAVIVDADSVDPNLVEDRKRFLNHSLASIPTPARRLALVFSPEIEVVLFETKSLVDEFVGSPVSDTDFVQGQYEPKKILEKLIGKATLRRTIAERVLKLNLTPIHNHPLIRELSQFVASTTLNTAVR
jgi:hypothetical protein